jgi:hypothetical protein
LKPLEDKNAKLERLCDQQNADRKQAITRSQDRIIESLLLATPEVSTMRLLHPIPS